MRVSAAVLLATAACSSGGSKKEAPGHDAAAEIADAGAAREADAKAYRRALRRGRELAQQGDAPGAVAAFQEALAARPDDARALSELSWAALGAGDLGLAARSAQRSIDLATEPRVQAASLYNLGRIREEQGDPAAALEAYRRSLALRPNRTVERRVLALAAPAGSAWTDAPVPLAGPFADLAAFCADLGLDTDDSDDAWCLPEGTAVAAVAELPAPFDRMVQLRHGEAPADTSIDLALHTAAGWYVLTDFGADGPWTGTDVTAVEVAHGRIVLRARAWQGRLEAYRADTITVCGVGASGRPSCLGPVVIRESELPGGPSGSDSDEIVEVEYTATLHAGDVLSIVPKTPDKDADISGEHPLVFP
jgi:tetratricopeptide (TPR) repeat protein